MGERRLQQRQNHVAVDDVMKVLSKASLDLAIVQRHLDLEFQHSYPDHANPCKIVARIKKIQEDLVSLKELCRELLAEKQDLIDKARTILVGQRSSLQRLLASSGLPLISESDDMAYRNLNLGMPDEGGGTGIYFIIMQTLQLCSKFKAWQSNSANEIPTLLRNTPSNSNSLKIKVIDEWTTQVRAKTGDEKDADVDINQMLFSAIVHNS